MHIIRRLSRFVAIILPASHTGDGENSHPKSWYPLQSVTTLGALLWS